MNTRIVGETSVFRVAVPWILGISLDLSGSVSNELAAMKEAVTVFLSNIYRRSRQLSGNLSDWVVLNGFREDMVIGPPDFLEVVKMDDVSCVAMLNEWVESLEAKGATPMYDGIGIAATDVLRVTRSLPSDVYIKAVIGITDGQENNSRQWSLKKLEHFFACSGIHLAGIGVGSAGKAAVQVFEDAGIATSTHAIQDFSELYYAMTTIMEGVLTETWGIRW